MTKKLLKYTVAIILRDAYDPNKILLVQRPDGSDLDGHWGFPAVTLLPGELPEDGARRVCREKLNCRAVPVRFIGAMYQKRNSYDILLMDIEMVLQDANESPDVTQARTEGTAYIVQKWTTDLRELMPSALEGSCCSSIFLTDCGLLDREAWLLSLEGSSLVG